MFSTLLCKSLTSSQPRNINTSQIRRDPTQRLVQLAQPFVPRVGDEDTGFLRVDGGVGEVGGVGEGGLMRAGAVDGAGQYGGE